MEKTLYFTIYMYHVYVVPITMLSLSEKGATVKSVASCLRSDTWSNKLSSPLWLNVYGYN